ncbi:MAG TPA: S9 family peptidase [Pyrinomonadaceae bacterium]|nr:S9 family peptidase [Pyrinomonadaceae bacterium]
MKRPLFIFAVFTSIIISVGNITIIAQNDMKPPVAKKETRVTKINGYELKDDYFWLRSAKDPKTGRVNKEVEDYLLAENAYTEAVMKSTADFQTKLYDEMLGHIKQTDLSVPYKLGEYWYYTKTEEGKQYPLYFRSKKANGDDERLLLDQNEMAKGFKYFAIGSFDVSDDGNLLAFSTDSTGYRQYTLQIKDLRTGQILPDKIERVTSVEWANDNKTLFFVTEDDVTKRSDKFWKHTLGSKENTLVYNEKDELFGLGVGRSRDKKMMFLSSHAATMREYRYLPADQPNADWKIVLPRERDHEYAVDHYAGEFYITTNKKAENFRVVRAPVADPTEKNWTDFVPHNPAIKVEGVDFFKDYAVVSEVENGLEYLKVMDLKTKRATTRIATPESVYTMGMSTNPEFETASIRYSYASMITPGSTYEYNLKTRESKLLKQQEIPSGYDKVQYETQRIWATARDGVKVPVSLVMKKGTKLDGSAPMLLYAYGSYGISMTPSFSTARLSLVDRGMIYAVAHIRGGSELGERWRQEGRMFKKMNTFNDFIDTADYLIKNKYTAPDRLVIQGGSAGGLLVGAVSNMRPDLFKAVIAQVPFVDVMNTMLDASLPLTTGEYIEWGNPNEKEAFDYMIKYSPYDNVKAQKYPNMLIETSLNDSQVPYWEGAKLAAKIRELKTDDNTVLLKTNMGAGHGGASGRYDRLKEIAFSYAYALKQVGITK